MNLSLFVRPALKNVFMLEFHPTLAIAGCIPTALEHMIWVRRKTNKKIPSQFSFSYIICSHLRQNCFTMCLEKRNEKVLKVVLLAQKLHHNVGAANVTEELNAEVRIMDIALRRWEEMEAAGSSYTSQVQKDVSPRGHKDVATQKMLLGIFVARGAFLSVFQFTSFVQNLTRMTLSLTYSLYTNLSPHLDGINVLLTLAAILGRFCGGSFVHVRSCANRGRAAGA